MKALELLYSTACKSTRKMVISFAPVAIALALCGPAWADQDWDGDNGVGNLSYNNNWYGDSEPGWGFGGSLRFRHNNGSASSLYYDYGGWVDTESIYWQDSFGEMTISGNGNGIKFGQRVENNVSGTQTINIPLSGGKNEAPQIELNPVAGNLVFQQTIYNDNSKDFHVYGNNGHVLTLEAGIPGNNPGIKFIIQQYSVVELAAGPAAGQLGVAAQRVDHVVWRNGRHE